MSFNLFRPIQKHGFIKALDNRIGPLLVRLFSVAQVFDRDGAPLRRVLFVRPGGLGDALLLLPVIEAFMCKFPDAEIAVLAEARNRAAFVFLSRQVSVETYMQLGAFFRLRRKRYDLIIDTEQWYYLSAIYARLLKPKRLIGFETNERRRLLTDRVSYSPKDYEVNCFYRLLNPLGDCFDLSDKLPQIEIDSQIVKRTRTSFGLDEKRTKIAVFPGASVPEKCWPTRHYIQMCTELEAMDCQIIIVGAALERSVAAEIASSISCLNLAGLTTLEETAAVLGCMDLLVTGDSAMLHLAASLNTSTLSLFGPTCADKWAPRGERHASLKAQLDCMPCSRYGHVPRCPHHVKCLEELTPEKVLGAAKKLLSAEKEVGR